METAIAACASLLTVTFCLWVRLVWEMRKFRKETEELVKKFGPIDSVPE